MRADGQRSRARLLTAAEQVVARDGASASLEEIARVAGVGSATLHRHFPTRWVLLQAIFQERVEGLAALADTLVHGDEPDASLAKWLAELASITAGTSGLADTLLAQATPTAPADTTCHQVVTQAGERLLSAAQASGHVRPDVQIDELLTLVTAISAIPDPTSRSRMLAVVIAGLGNTPSIASS